MYEVFNNNVYTDLSFACLLIEEDEINVPIALSAFRDEMPVDFD